MTTVQVGDQTLYYQTFGPVDGPPLLLMHGWMEVGRDLGIVADSLAGAGYRVILPDVCGYGRSTPPNRTYPPDFYQRDARVMAGLLDALGIEKAHIMGFSDGGEIALLMGVLRPDRCRSVIAWGAVGHYTPEVGNYVRNSPPSPITPGQRARHANQNIDHWAAEWAQAFLTIVEAGGDLSRSRAHEIACPLLLMVGDRDALNPVSDAQAFVAAATHPACTPKVFTVFPDTGHRIHDERIDAFLAAVFGFLRSF